jgi:hypothetical protein
LKERENGGRTLVIDACGTLLTLGEERERKKELSSIHGDISTETALAAALAFKKY